MAGLGAFSMASLCPELLKNESDDSVSSESSLENSGQFSPPCLDPKTRHNNTANKSETKNTGRSPMRE